MALLASSCWGRGWGVSEERPLCLRGHQRRRTAWVLGPQAKRWPGLRAFPGGSRKSLAPPSSRSPFSNTGAITSEGSVQRPQRHTGRPPCSRPPGRASWPVGVSSRRGRPAWSSRAAGGSATGAGKWRWRRPPSSRQHGGATVPGVSTRPRGTRPSCCRQPSEDTEHSRGGSTGAGLPRGGGEREGGRSPWPAAPPA